MGFPIGGAVRSKQSQQVMPMTSTCQKSFDNFRKTNQTITVDQEWNDHPLNQLNEENFDADKKVPQNQKAMKGT